MNGHENLIPASERTPEERAENGRRGGIASGAARREKRRTLDMIEAWLEQRSADDVSISNEDAYILAVIRRGIKTGDPALLELLAKLRGELVQKSEIDLNGAIPTILTDDLIVTDDVPEDLPGAAE